MVKYDKILTLGLVILDLIYFILIKELPEKAAKYPFFVLGLLVILTILLGIKSFLFSGGSEEVKLFSGFMIKQFSFVVIVSLIYIFILEILGFFSTTFLYLLINMLGLKGNLKWSILSSMVFCVLIYLIFVVFLKVPVPKGILI